MNKAKALDFIARKQREILDLAERLHDAGHEAALAHSGVGSSSIVLIGRQLDPFSLAIEQAWINVTGENVPISPELALAVRLALEAMVAMQFAPGESERFDAMMRSAVDGLKPER